MDCKNNLILIFTTASRKSLIDLPTDYSSTVAQNAELVVQMYENQYFLLSFDDITKV